VNSKIFPKAEITFCMVYLSGLAPYSVNGTMRNIRNATPFVSS
jgi:hypothetical protein